MPARTIDTAALDASYDTLEEFLERPESVNGLIQIGQPLPIHVHWTDHGSDTTFVVFSGAMSAKFATVPLFGGYGTTRSLAANVLLISDPVLMLDQSLTMGWYAGAADLPELQLDMTAIIGSLAGDSRVVLFGPSGGGFPALEQATRFPGSTVLLSNPLTHVNLESRGHVDVYFETAWRTAAPEEPADAPFVNEMISVYSEPIDTQIVCIQNLGDARHIRLHWGPFVRSLHPDNRVLTVNPDLGPGHIGPGKKSFVQLFHAVTDYSAWDDIQAAVRAVDITLA